MVELPAAAARTEPLGPTHVQRATPQAWSAGTLRQALQGGRPRRTLAERAAPPVPSMSSPPQDPRLPAPADPLQKASAMGCLTILVPLAVLVAIAVTPLTWWQCMLVLLGAFALSVAVHMKRNYGRPGGYTIDSVEQRRAARAPTDWPVDGGQVSPNPGPGTASAQPVTYTSRPNPAVAAQAKLARLEGFVTQARGAGGQTTALVTVLLRPTQANSARLPGRPNDFVNSPALRAEDAVRADEVRSACGDGNALVV